MGYFRSAHAPNLRKLQLSRDGTFISPIFEDNGALELQFLDIFYVYPSLLNYNGSSFHSVTTIRLSGPMFMTVLELATFLGSFPRLQQLYLLTENIAWAGLSVGDLPRGSFIIPSLAALELGFCAHSLTQLFMKNEYLRVFKPPCLHSINPISALSSPWVQVLIVSSLVTRY